MLIALILMIPSRTFGIASTADSLLVPRAVLERTSAVIDSLDAHIVYQDSVIVAQREYYTELLALYDKHVAQLREVIKDCEGSYIMGFLEKLTYALAGYGLRAAGD